MSRQRLPEGTGRSRSTGGFTILESVIALSLLGLILLGAFGLLISSYGIMRATQDSIYVTRLLETAIEMTRNLSFTDIAGDPSGVPVGFASATPVTFTTDSTLLLGANGEILYGKGLPERTDPAAEMKLNAGSGKVHFVKLSNDLYKITAEVTYKTFGGRPVAQSATTYIARKGINRR